MVARDVASGKLAGALIAEDFASPLPLEPENLSPKFQPIMSLVGQAWATSTAQGRTLSSGQYLHVLILATDRRYRGRGVAQQLVKRNGRERSRAGLPSCRHGTHGSRRAAHLPESRIYRALPRSSCRLPACVRARHLRRSRPRSRNSDGQVVGVVAPIARIAIARFRRYDWGVWHFVRLWRGRRRPFLRKCGTPMPAGAVSTPGSAGFSPASRV